MSTITYKGYTGQYKLYEDGKDGTTYYAGDIPSVGQYGKVLFEGENMEELTEDFHAAVEDCICHGYVPAERTHRITIPGSLYMQLAAKARQNGQSVSHYVSRALASILL